MEGEKGGNWRYGMEIYYAHHEQQGKIKGRKELFVVYFDASK